MENISNSLKSSFDSLPVTTATQEQEVSSVSTTYPPAEPHNSNSTTHSIPLIIHIEKLMWVQEIEKLIEKHQENIYNEVTKKGGWDGRKVGSNITSKWEFPEALLYAVSAITTIGKPTCRLYLRKIKL